MRVLCLAWDSPDPIALQQGVDDGSLPCLAALLQRGSSAVIDDTQEILTPASWPTMNRGITPARHGQLSDRQLVPGTYRQAPVMAEDADEPPFWHHLGEAGLRCTIASVYSAPLLETLPGTQVVGWGNHDPYTTKGRAGRSIPPGLIDDLERMVGKRELRYGLKLPQTQDDHLAYLDRTLRGIEQQGTALSHLASETEWDFFFGSIADGHEAGHVLWHFNDREHSLFDPRAHERLRGSIPAIYEAIDRALARVLAQLREDDVILIVTPYGLGPNPHLEEVGEAVLEAAGFLSLLSADGAATGGSARIRAMGKARGVVHRVVPASLRPALGRLVPRDRWVDALALAHIDWQSTRAFILYGDGSTLPRLNLQGREPEGTVSPEDYESTCDEIIAVFTELVDADTGEPVVTRAARFAEVGGGRPSGPMPDLCVQWRHGQRPRAIRSDRVGEIEVVSQVPRESLHWTNGFVIGAGPGIAPEAAGRLVNGTTARLVDLGPTVLDLFGVTGHDMDGRALWPRSR